MKNDVDVTRRRLLIAVGALGSGFAVSGVATAAETPGTGSSETENMLRCQQSRKKPIKKSTEQSEELKVVVEEKAELIIIKEQHVTPGSEAHLKAVKNGMQCTPVRG